MLMLLSPDLLFSSNRNQTDGASRYLKDGAFSDVATMESLLIRN